MREPLPRQYPRRVLLPALALLLAAPAVAQDGPAEPPAADAPQAPPHRVFPASRFDVDAILARPDSPDVPFGSTGGRLWASSPRGWAFEEGVHWLYLTDIPALDLQLRDEAGYLRPARGTAAPSHVRLEGAAREAVASASFTFRADSVAAPLQKPFDPERRWTCWSSGRREDWYAIDFGGERTLTGLKLHLYDDTGRGSIRPPEGYTVQAWSGGEWKAVETSEFRPKRPAPGENVVTFAAPVRSDRFRLSFRHAGENFYTGLYGLEPAFDGAEPPVTLRVEGDKFIAPDDILVAVLRVTNPTAEPAYVQVVPVLGWQGQQEFRWLSNRQPAGEEEAGAWALEGAWATRYHEQDVRQFFRFTAASDPPTPQVIHENLRTTLADSKGPADNLTFMREAVPLAYKLEPGETKVFKAALEFRQVDEPALIDNVLSAATTVPRIRRRGRDDPSRFGSIEVEQQDARPVVAEQAAAYQAWFDANLAYFDCSDPLVAKMYYHRAYTLRKNMMEPRLGALKHPTQAEGRWRSAWYPHVISYGGAHQVREARWLRDPRYWRGHLATWAENKKADGVYPARVLPSGPTDWQYTDWITSTAWDGHLVHPDAEALAPLVDSLAENVRGLQRAYDPDGDGLLRVDSHWWTGMEYQPSFFFFGDFKARDDFYEPAEQVALDRVDFTSYFYGNARAVAQLYRALGRADKAREFDDLAAKVAASVREKMWKSDAAFFYSLRADDGAVADVKEIIGVYPFYFGMLPPGEGYEAAWASILDPEQFWTPWPVASASKQTPAYSQSGWPQADGRAVACMWNGPTWPHANSIVLTAMARTLRADRDLGAKASPLTREKFYELFASFTKAQYRDGDPANPWTGEFYDGETGAWKTAERDYNHSTWLDVLIPEVLGLVPREDDILEIDPLLPPGALSHFVLDGQHYRGRDVTIVWDAPDDATDLHDDGRSGLDVYVDGRLAASSESLSRLLIDLETGKPAR